MMSSLRGSRRHRCPQIRVGIRGLLLFATITLFGCNDVGDSSAIPCTDGATSDDGTTVSLDSATASPPSDSAGGASPTDATQDHTADAEASTTGLSNATDAGTSTAVDSSPASTGMPDATTEDTGSSEEASAEDATVGDAGVDATLQDSAADATEDTTQDSTLDAVEDTTPVEAAAEAGDSAPGDGGGDATQEAATDAADAAEAAADAADAAETGSTKGPCTTSGQTNCVQCQGNMDGVCSPTEAALVQHDIDAGLDPNDPAMASCYSCLWNAGCIDDNVLGDSNNECGDLSGNFDAGPQAGTSDTDLCMATLACVLSTGCAGPAGVAGEAGAASADIQICYCGGNFTGTACDMAGSAVDGLCVTDETNGLGYAPSDNANVLTHFGNKALPSGKANAIFSCAKSHMCTACVQ